MGKNYLGVDIGGTFIKLGIVDDAGNVRMRREVPIDRSGSATVMETVMSGIDALLKDCGLEADAFEGIGVSSAGCIDTTKGCVAENGGNIPNWSYTSVAGPLSERYGIAATIANDGNCVALAEAWIGAAKGVKDVILRSSGNRCRRWNYLRRQTHRGLTRIRWRNRPLPDTCRSADDRREKVGFAL